jgi:hypothetical protein
MKKILLYCIVTLWLVADESEIDTMAHDELSRFIQDEYEKFKKEKAITPEKERALTYNLSIFGGGMDNEYTLDGLTMLKIKSILEYAIGAQPNQWYVVQIDSLPDDNYGIEEHTVASVALNQEQLEKLIPFIPQIQEDLDATKNGDDVIA